LEKGEGVGTLEDQMMVVAGIRHKKRLKIYCQQVLNPSQNVFT
jgi:hypothetical protein